RPYCALLVADSSLKQAEGKARTPGRPGVRTMVGVLRFGQTFRRSRMICALPEDSIVALPIGLEHDAFTICGPDRIVVHSPERQAADRASTRNVVYINVRILAITKHKCQSLGVGRNAWITVESRRQCQWLSLSVSVNKGQCGFCALHLSGRRNVNQRSV